MGSWRMSVQTFVHIYTDQDVKMRELRSGMKVNGPAASLLPSLCLLLHTRVLAAELGLMDAGGL